MLLRWAREDAKRFDSVSNAFFDGDPYVMFSEIDPETREEAFKARPRDAPNELQKLAAHILVDLKSALDQATFAAVSPLLNRMPTQAYFPFASHPNNLRAKLEKGPYPVELRGVFEGFEPYPRGNDYAGGDDEFCELSRMANTGKHIVAVSARPEVHVASLTGTSTAGMKIPWPGWDRAKQELTYLVVPVGAHIKIEGKIAGFVAFSGVETLEAEPAGNVIKVFIDCVEEVIDTLEWAVTTILSVPR